MSLFLADDHIGLNSDQIGWVLGISPIVSIFAIPYWSGIADRTDKKKTISILVAAQAFFFCLFAVPSL